MKLKFILSLVVLAFYALGLKLVDFFYSPITGTLSAQQVNDSTTDYALAKFVRDGHLQGSMLILTVLAIVLIWLIVPNRKTV
jgi:hypothetical protein